MANQMRRILVIEDDQETAQQVADCLRTSGYDVDLAADGLEGFELGRAGSYAAMTVDRLLPGIDGVEVIRSLRAERIETPALILSALGEVDDRVRGLRAGGDDYLVKPFAFPELVARIEALVRRNPTIARETLLRIGDLHIDLLARTVHRAGRPIELLPREFKLLSYLAHNEGQIISRSMLLQHVWDLHFDPTTNV